MEKIQEPITKKMKVEVKQSEAVHCKHFVVRKKRFCKMTLAKGKEYCGEHCPQELSESGDNNPIERIPCPLDAKHTVYKKNLEKHLRICNAKPKENPKYVAPNINAGSDTEEAQDSHIENIKLQDIDEKTMDELINKIENLYNKFIKSTIEELILEHEIMSNELSNEKYGKETRKHLIQTSSILGYLKYLSMLQDNTSFIEFGAGKGQVSYWLAQAISDTKNSKVILIDRASHRHKKDNKIEDRNLIHRIRVDIADFDIRKVPINNGSSIVAVSKHLCGAATDLALRCFLLGNQNTEATSFVKCFIIALCCHHRCEWKSFIGKKFFKENDLTVKDFTIITKMVGWAVCGSGYSRKRRQEIIENGKKRESNGTESEEKTIGKFTRERKEEIGIMCKRILDYSRLRFMEDHGFECSLKYYVDSDITLENVCLIGTLKK